MSENSGIQWTTHTFNPWWGCTRVSHGCVHCYAETLATRFGVGWGPSGERRLFGDKHWNEPKKWDKKAAAAGERHRVFCASMADVFEDRPELAAERARLFRLIRETPHLDWLLLTKRPELAVCLWSRAHVESSTEEPLGRLWAPNVWLGTTAEDQQRADERIPFLLGTGAEVKFVSYEPALGPVDFRPWLHGVEEHGVDLSREIGSKVGGCIGYTPPLDWLIVGGESGPGARPFDVAWARSTVEQCKAAGVACFYKQGGASNRCPHDTKGGHFECFPPDLQIREFPKDALHLAAMQREREELWRAQEVIRRLTKWDSGKMEFTHADDSRISEWEQMIVKKAHAALAAAKELG